MIRISVMYPNQPGARFDMDYYAESHMDMVHRCFDSHGLRGVTIDRGVGGGTSGSEAPYLCMGVLTFDSMASYKEAFKIHGKALMADISNFTDIVPEVQVSEVVL